MGGNFINEDVAQTLHILCNNLNYLALHQMGVLVRSLQLYQVCL